MLGPALASRMRPADVIAAGVGLAGVGFLALTQVDRGSGLAALVAGGTIAFLGIAPTGVLATDMVVGSAPADNAGSASAVSETTAELGAALGVAIFGSIGTAVYRMKVDAAVPADTPAAAIDAARNSLAGAAAAAADLPASLGPELLEAAREAFTDALNLVAVVGVAAMVVFAVLAVTLGRRIGPVEPATTRKPRQARGPTPTRLVSAMPATRRGADRRRRWLGDHTARPRAWSAPLPSMTNPIPRRRRRSAGDRR
jgi:MFS transporter, DHA2 family, multidrug resistance protein